MYGCKQKFFLAQTSVHIYHSVVRAFNVCLCVVLFVNFYILLLFAWTFRIRIETHVLFLEDHRQHQHKYNSTLVLMLLLLTYIVRTFRNKIIETKQSYKLPIFPSLSEPFRKLCAVLLQSVFSEINWDCMEKFFDCFGARVCLSRSLFCVQKSFGQIKYNKSTHSEQSAKVANKVVVHSI